MKHAEYQQLISQFIDRELRSEEEQGLFAHLGGCSGCREFLRKSIRLQADLAANKAEAMKMRHSGTRPPYDANRPALAGEAHQGRYSRVRAIALLMIIVIAAGLLWSTTLPRQSSDQYDLTRQTSPSEIPTYQP